MAFKPQKQTMEGLTLPAPIRGVDATQNASVMDPLNCIYMFNIMPKEFGLTVREGYREWANGFESDDGARTLLPFYGLAEDESDDKLFAATTTGIWDVTPDGETAPVQVVTWPIQGAGAGVCIYTQFVSDAGAFLLVCDGDNGYYTYEGGAADTWTEVPNGGGGVTGPGDPRDFAFITVWKNRVWVVEKESGSAWYGPLNSFLGTFTEFQFGNRFRYGGHLVGLWSWTLDGGDGIDDYIVAISEAGDVLIYQGTDPAQVSSFEQKGSWYIGAMPAGRRVASEFGGDLLVLSTYGVTSMASVTKGKFIGDQSEYLTDKIAPYIRVLMNDAREGAGWEINTYPREGLVVIDAPKIVGKKSIQFVYDITTKGWGFWRDIPINTMAPWHGNFYFGDNVENRIWMFDGTIDRVYIDPDTDGGPLTIDWSMLTSYQNFNAPQIKIGQLVRPVFSAEALPSFEAVFRYDFDISEIATGPIFGSDGFAGTWDVASWDVAVWGGGRVGADNPQGASGIGRYIAVALRGSSANKTTLLAFDLNYTLGGFL